MRRPLHIAVALSALALGLVIAGAPEQIPYALPSVTLVGLALSALWRRVRLPLFDAHRVRVAALTLVLWTPVLALFLPLFAQQLSASCTPLDDDYYYHEPPAATGALPEAPEVTRLTSGWDVEGPCWPGPSAEADDYADLPWYGPLDARATVKPAPFYPLHARDSHVAGTVAVAVLADADGMVLSARSLSGHPLLRPEAARAACFARLRPALVDGRPARVSGLLTYRFRP